MEKKWTEPQKQALIIPTSNVLVSAGAGSGKTAVLTTLISNILCDKTHGANLDELLVLTFTNKAAFEMRSRVKTTLKTIPELAYLADEVDASNIVTFDAYALSIVKKYGYLLNIRSNVSIVDPNIFYVKAHHFLEEILDSYYHEKDSLFLDLIYKYIVKDDSLIYEAVFNILNVANLQLNKEEFFKNYEAKYFSKEYLNKCIELLFQLLKENILEARKYYIQISRTDFVEKLDHIFYEPLVSNNYDSLYNSIFSEENLSIRKPNGLDDGDSELWDASKTLLMSETRSIMKELGDTQSIINNELITNKYVGLLLKIAQELDDKLFKFKLEYNVFTFSDIASLAYKIVNIPSVNETLKQKIKFIMIDEYQDTSDIQDAFIASISHNNVFMVGDIKQSIYRFRNANPTLFKQNYDKYLNNDGGKLICFPDNFRSRQEVVNSINNVFKDIMNENYGGVNYDNHQALKYANLDYLNLGNTSQEYGVKLLRYTNDLGLDLNEIEARLVAEDILRKISTNYQVFDRDLRQLRPCSYRDFTILIDRTTNYDVYEKVFNDYKIPLVSYTEKDVRKTPLIMVLKSVLKLIILIQKNELSGHDFEHAYASIARSYLYSLKDSEIFAIIKNHRITDTDIYLTISDMATSIKGLSLKDSVLYIINHCPIQNNLYLIGDVLINQSILENVVSLAGNMDSIDYSFSDMVQFFLDLDSYDVQLKMEFDATSGDSVQLMTMHKSKGLEFHIVYCCGLNSKFNPTAYKGNYIYSSTFGIHFPNKESNAKTFLFKYLSQGKERQDDISEKVRLLYVALTRTEENAYVYLPDVIFKKVSPSVAKSQNLASFFCSYSHLFEEIKDISLPEKMFENKDIEAKGDIVHFDIKSINVEPVSCQIQHASKELKFQNNEKALLYGTHIHELLQIVDFKIKNCSFIKDTYERKLVEDVVRNPLFDNTNNAKIYQELDFFDEENGIHGTIDLLLIYEDHIDIVDYKLKNVSDEEYDKQLNYYESYVKKISDLTINKYLVSVLDKTTRRVN